MISVKASLNGNHIYKHFLTFSFQVNFYNGGIKGTTYQLYQ